eukprot:4385593-Prorocentrum_lima.AAC.1
MDVERCPGYGVVNEFVPAISRSCTPYGLLHKRPLLAFQSTYPSAILYFQKACIESCSSSCAMK